MNTFKFCLLLVILLFMPSSLLAKKHPKIRIEKREIHLGTIDKNEMQEVSFSIQFTNVGKAPLTIKNVDSGCDCTEVLFDHNAVYAKGDKGVMTVVFKVADVRPQSLFRVVTIYSNAKNSEESVTFYARIVDNSTDD